MTCSPKHYEAIERPSMTEVHEDLKQVPGIKFVDHVAIAVKSR